jgi:hypothetical protein
MAWLSGTFGFSLPLLLRKDGGRFVALSLAYLVALCRKIGFGIVVCRREEKRRGLRFNVVLPHLADLMLNV